MVTFPIMYSVYHGAQKPGKSGEQVIGESVWNTVLFTVHVKDFA